jgi:Na+-driven multidrug efflux pump
MDVALLAEDAKICNGPAKQPEDAISTKTLEELRALVQLSWPVALASFFVAAIDTSDTAFVGHIGTDELTGAGLAYSWTEFLAWFVWSSAYALNSLCAQAIGAGNPKLAGLWLQLALALIVLLAVPVTIAHFFTGPLLALVCGHKGNLARAIHFGQVYNTWAAMTFLPSCIYMALTQYFQALEIVMPATFVSAVAVGVNIAGNQLLIWGSGSWHGLGLRGSALASLFSALFQLGAFYAFAVQYKQYVLYTPYTLYTLYTHTMHTRCMPPHTANSYALYSLCTVLTLHYTPSALYLLCTILQVPPTLLGWLDARLLQTGPRPQLSSRCGSDDSWKLL